MPQPRPALIFDLDGTLTDSKPGIVNCLRKVLDDRKMGDQGALERFVGPPVEVWATELLPHGSDEDRVAMIRDYRACYDREGWNDNSVYPGVNAMLDDLRTAGFALYVCTSKPRHFAVRILDFFNLSGKFVAIYGDMPEFVNHGKVDLLASLLREQKLAPESAWMIGDRVYDYRAARANGVRSLAAEWGYGSAAEYAEADAIAAAPADVLRWAESVSSAG